MFSLHEGIHTLRWSCCRLCSDWSRWSLSAPSPQGASSCCPSTLSLLCTRSLKHGTASPPTLEFGAKSLLPTTHWLWLTLAPWDQGCSPPGSRAELLYSNPQQLCLHPTTATQSPAAQGWPQEKAFHLVQKCLAEGFLFSGVPMPSPSISQADAVQRVSERPQKMQPAATTQGRVTEVKEEFRKFQQEHTQERPKAPVPATVFTFISWSEGIFQVRKEEKNPGRKHCRRKRNNSITLFFQFFVL